jgi:hypothetical protein
LLPYAEGLRQGRGLGLSSRCGVECKKLLYRLPSVVESERRVAARSTVVALRRQSRGRHQHTGSRDNLLWACASQLSPTSRARLQDTVKMSRGVRLDDASAFVGPSELSGAGLSDWCSSVHRHATRGTSRVCSCKLRQHAEIIYYMYSIPDYVRIASRVSQNAPYSPPCRLTCHYQPLFTSSRDTAFST